MMRSWWILPLIALLWACSGDQGSDSWCDTRTVSALQALQGAAPGSNWCATVQGKLVFRKDENRCRQGAYYLEDSTGSMFVCDPNKPSTVTDSGVVACAREVLNFGKDTTLQVAVRAEGLYYPAKIICQSISFCWCQNGLEVDRVEKESEE